ncbi:tripartite tricarboxylate transporter substrate binding protein [Mangrovibrevibacter kandeliae]|uniref:tripartite tricarboxylate transporter substrate binding protein n=1 Tax=Mangrovibrevibacter kandeliae TaxID=2968473 RepID=UPI0021180E0B|nr:MULTISPECIES: tripartite tricarboxylate transporter substrate binding protein [unclassified Aurantimonas]MCQ8781201.1 tripartite tricarboxylate transporter substrate binding protein [Aurantimonas sp. CSK15Z-1]MCW4113978.1 tripartite tricarboxylate transporter substrate binding protein [Aurantimonas sp. MSK8Z-1]
MSLKLTAITVAFLAGVVPAATAQAADGYPTKSVEYIIPFNAGGESDVSARFQQATWEKMFGQQLVIQYMAGAGGAQAWSQLNSLPDDGYTIMGINLPHTVLQPMEKDVGYKTEDLTPVNYFHYTPDAIFVGKDSQFQTLKDLVDYAKQNPGLVTFSGSGSNSSNNLAQARLDDLAGITTTYIPFSGTSPAITAVLGGQTIAGFNYVTSGVSQGDALKMLAVAADERLPAFPDVPTFKELGYDLVGGAYRGVAVPKSASEEVRKAVSDAVSKVNADPDFKKKMEDAGFVLTDLPYEKMGTFMAEKQKEYEAGAAKLGIAAK